MPEPSRGPCQKHCGEHQVSEQKCKEARCGLGSRGRKRLGPYYPDAPSLLVRPGDTEPFQEDLVAYQDGFTC